jgi:HK97 family phage major capsid protein
MAEKDPVQEVMNAFEEFKRVNDANQKKRDDNLEAQIDKLNQHFDKFEPLNQKLTAAEQSAKAMQEQVDNIEATINRMAISGKKKDPEDLKAFVNTWARGVIAANTVGIVNLTDDQRAALDDVGKRYASLSVGNDTTGGYLAPIEYVREIIKGVTEFSPMRSMVRVRQTMSKSIQLPKRTGQFAAQWVAEQGTRSETTGQTYGMEEIHAHEMYALIDISSQNLEDSAFDLEAEIREEAQTQFAVAEGAAVVSGNGVGKPEGMLINASVGITNSGAAAAITADGILNLYYDIKTAYSKNGMYCLNRSSLKTVRTLKNGNGEYLWVPGLAAGIPNTINGAPYVECPDMPSQGANTFPVCFGDFRRGYVLVDRIAMTMLRDPFTQATSGNIRFMFRRRLGGQVVLAEAMRKLKCAV